MNYLKKKDVVITNFKEMGKKFVITLLLLSVYQIGMLIFVPGINISGLKELFKTNMLLKTMSAFSSNSIERCSIFAMNIGPYISASILVQMLSSSSGFEYFQKLKKDKESGSTQLNSITQYFTIFIAFLNAIGFCYMIYNHSNSGVSLVFTSKIRFFSTAIAIWVGGSIASVWIANQITKYGLGNGSSILIFVNVMTGMSGKIYGIYEALKSSKISYYIFFQIIAFFVMLFVFVIFVEKSERNIAIKHPGIENNNVTSYIPIKINNAGVIPPMLASYFSNAPSLVMQLLQRIGFYTEFISKHIVKFNYGGSLYFIFHAILIFSLTYTQTYLVFDPSEIATNLQSNGIVVVDHRPSEDTSEYIEKVLKYMNFLSGIYLILICVVSEYFCCFIESETGLNISMGGTTILIGVSVAQLIFQNLKRYHYSSIIDRIKAKELSK